LNIVARTTTPGADFVPAAERVATFDQDGTTWVEQPLYAELQFSLDRIIALSANHPEWNTTAPYSAVINRDTLSVAAFGADDWEKIVAVSHRGQVSNFNAQVAAWIARARDARWHRKYTDLVYQPMLEAMRYLRTQGYRTYIVTGGTQAFVRNYAQAAYEIPPEQIIGTALANHFDTTEHGDVMMLAPKVLLDNNYSGKAEDIYLFTGRRPQIAFGNSDGDAEMLQYTSGNKAAAMFLVLHDDSKREYAYGPANGLPDSKVGHFSQSLYERATSSGWHIVSMKRDWKKIFTWQ
jgi:hypothetical protein